MIGRHLRMWAATLTTSALVGACGAPPADSTSPGTPETGTLQVLAAASLHTTFAGIGKLFEADYPGVRVEFTFAGSSDLVTQLTQGAPADLLATADTPNMDKAVKAGLVDKPVNFAANTLTIVTAPGNPKHISSFRDLTRPGLSLVVCAPQVPCGSATTRIATSLAVHLNPVSEEMSVTDVLNKVTTGQADAGLVYVTDAATAANSVAAVNFPQASSTINVYPIAVTTNTRSPRLAKAFSDLVTSSAGRRILQAAGFAAP